MPHFITPRLLLKKYMILKNGSTTTKQMDWIHCDTGKLLTEYEMDGYLEYILKSCTDKELC
jgi:hypothetical protein